MNTLLLLAIVTAAAGLKMAVKDTPKEVYSRADWEKTTDSEVAYWDGAFKANPARFDKYFDRQEELKPGLRNYLNLPEKPSADSVTMLRILEVGAGVGGDMGWKSWPDTEVTLFISDPLAKSYSKLYQKYNKYPPQAVIPMLGEDVNTFFQKDSFDMVYTYNALDHAHEPLKAMKSMLAVAKPCRWVVVELHENEAEDEKGNGMHQWNFRKLADGSAELMQYHTKETFNVTAEMLGAGAMASYTQTGKESCFIVGQCATPENAPAMRMSVRKGPMPGETCPPNPRAPAPFVTADHKQ